MKRVGFFEGVSIALVASIGASVLFMALTSFFAMDFVLRVLIAAMGLMYTLYLLQRSGEKAGRITSVVMWLAAATTLWLLGPGLPVYLLGHLCLIWLIRTLYYHSSLISALLDFGLVLFGAAAALWAGSETGNFFLSVWSFFLVQALFAAIPKRWLHSRETPKQANPLHDRFQEAYRAAEAAIRKLTIARQ